MAEVNFNCSSARRLARQIVDFREDKRKAILRSLTSEMKCRVVEEMVMIRFERMRRPDGTISPAKVSER